MIYDLKDPITYRSQWPFQVKYATGKILNVGCNNDGALFRERGAINIDLTTFDECNGQVIPAHALADARALPFRPVFDSVVLGEILEHFTASDARIALDQARAALKPGGRIVATLPHDNRPPEKQGYTGMLHVGYAPGVSRYHAREITRIEFFEWLKNAGLRLILWAKIAYTFGIEGTGIVAEAAC